MTGMTPTQGRYLSYIQAYTVGFGLPPAESEIAKAIGVASPTVNQMMKMLEKKGLIRRQPGVPRSIQILVARDIIPKWKGKRITRTVWERTLGRPPAERFKGESDSASLIYRLKIILEGTDPEIWRRIETEDVSLGGLHVLIQTAMGWTNSHLHEFRIANVRYTDLHLIDNGIDESGAIDYSGIQIRTLRSQHESKLRLHYAYDFGDGWEHDVILEEVTPREPSARYPRCIEGERACPPEDIGGVYGFEDYVKSITNPNHSQYAEFLEWNGPFDPAYFDAAKATRRMKKGLPKY